MIHFKEDALINAMTVILNLHWADNEFCELYLVDENGEEFGATDNELVPIPDTMVTMNNGESFICDGVLFFGDGCTEFHDKESCDAFNWCEFDDESFHKVEAEILKICEKKS